MALSANREVDRYVDQELRTLPVAASTHVYKGALVGLTGGYARGLVAGDAFVGIAYEEVDNSSGSAGDLMVRVFTLGDFGHTLTGASRANNSSAVYASDDETLTLTASGNSLVGHQVDVPSSNTIVLRIDTELFDGPMPQIVSPAAEVDCENASAEAVLIPASANVGGLLIEECVALVSEQFGGDTEDQGVITLKDTDGTSLNVTLTASDAGADAVNDLIVAAGTNKTAERGSTGDPGAVVAAGKGVKAVVTQATSGASAAGKMKVMVKAVRLGG